VGNVKVVAEVMEYRSEDKRKRRTDQYLRVLCAKIEVVLHCRLYALYTT
jgi:hypothetical protein